MSNTELEFAENPETDPPVPIESKGQVANSCSSTENIPEKLFPNEHTAEVGDMKVIRSGWNCPQCGSNVFLHPESIVPRNSVYCFNCSYAPLGIAWWENARLSDILS